LGKIIKNKERTFKGVLSSTERKLQDFLSLPEMNFIQAGFKKSVPAKS